MATPTSSEAHKMFPDPGSRNYFDLPRVSKHVVQKPVTNDLPYKELSLNNLMSKIPSLKFNKRAFAEGFAEKMANLPVNTCRDLLAKLYSIGISKQSAMVDGVEENSSAKEAGGGSSNQGLPPMQPQAPNKQQFNLGSQINRLGKNYIEPVQKESVGKVSAPDVQRKPLSAFLMQPTTILGSNQLKPGPGVTGNTNFSTSKGIA